MYFWLVLVFAIVIHEFGHWIIPKHLDLNPKVEIRWITVGIKCDMEDWIPIRMFIDIRILGIIMGYAMILLLGNPQDLFTLTIFYALLSSVDMITIIVLKIESHRQHAVTWGEMDWD